MSVTPLFTVTSPFTIYGEPARVHVVGLEIVPLTLVDPVAACMASGPAVDGAGGPSA